MIKYKFILANGGFMRIFFLLSVFVLSLWAKVFVAVSILPQKFFVNKIGKDLVDVTVMVPPGASPAVYSVKPSQLKALKKAKIYFAIGVPFEKAWLDKFISVNPSIKIVDTSSMIKKFPMNEEGKGNLDPHIWLSPPLVILQARVILDSLISIDPKNRDTFIKNYEKFVCEIASLDVKIMNILKDVKKREFIVFHPSFGYFARSYALRQIAIEREGKEPSAKYIQRIIKIAKKLKIKRIFVEPQFPKRSAKYIASKIKGEVVVIDPLNEKWDDNLLKIARALGNSD